MVLEIKPTTEDIEPEISRPSLFISEPTRQLRNENLLAQFAQDFVNIRSFAKNRSHRFSGCTTHATSQSSSAISGSSDRSTSIEWCWKSNQRQKTSNPRSRGQVCSFRNQPANCATKISSHSSRKTS